MDNFQKTDKNLLDFLFVCRIGMRVFGSRSGGGGGGGGGGSGVKGRGVVVLVPAVFFIVFGLVAAVYSQPSGLFPEDETNAAATQPNRPSICIFQPITSRLGRNETASGHALTLDAGTVPMMNFMATINKTLEVSDFAYYLYLGFDFDDPLWDLASTRADFARRFASVPLELRWVRLYGSGSQITLAYNTIARRAYDNGCQYFVFSNDDLQFETPNWASLAVQQLLAYDVPNFGTVGFADKTAPGNPSFHMVHRTHMDRVFDEFGPIYCPFPNPHAYCDYFIFDVYAPFGHAVMRMDIQVLNFRGGNNGSRYRAELPSRYYNQTLTFGRRLVRQSLVDAGKFNAQTMPDPDGGYYPEALWRFEGFRASSLVSSPHYLYLYNA